MSDDYAFIRDLVDGGELDGMLEGLAEAIQARRTYLREMRGAANKINFGPGTKVRLVNIKPKYLLHITGVVSSRMPSRRGDIMVDIDPRYHHRLGTRFSTCLGVPASSLEEIQ